MPWVPIMMWEGQYFSTCGPASRADGHLGPFLHQSPNSLSHVTDSPVSYYSRSLGIIPIPTESFAPFSNGVVERHNGLVKEMLKAIDRSGENFDFKQSLALVCYAKNCYLDRYGFSPFQRVFGRNPPVPNFSNENNKIIV